ncbi:hypothetical protein QVD17_42000 [Tagetes erecta]|uniref:Receptor-like serine/threonine-protein kinase n=1 Tax=Tagetes erecta TaxID=13708 RepID=A0AAD8JLB2_TARER|nr:hypothetical protein QVD17_42000 [Tagetes erecta]
MLHSQSEGLTLLLIISKKQGSISMELAAIFLILFCPLLFHKIYTVELRTISHSGLLTVGDTLVSDTGIFELGFFQLDSSANTYLGICYKNIPITTLVWVANRDQPLANSSMLMLRIINPGIFVLFNNMSMIWSSNTTTTSTNATAKLHDTGNLVLIDQYENVLWQSFDHPTEHWLPGMKLGVDYVRGIERHLSSWNNINQPPLVGEYTWAAEKHGYPNFVLKQGSTIVFRGELWRNQQLRGISSFSTNLTFTYETIINESEVSYSYDINRSSTLFRITLSSSGKYESWGWVEGGNSWEIGTTFPRDICDTYNICSAYGNCVNNMYDQYCTCLDEINFMPRNKKGWDAGVWTDGCIRRTPLDCKNGSETFVRYANVKLPDAQNRSWFNKSMNMIECEALCLKNCSCMAYANPDTSLGGRGCLLWFEELIDIRVYPEGNGGRDIFVRMASSELVAKSNPREKGANVKIILPVVFSGVLLIGVLTTWLWHKRKNNEEAKPFDEGDLLNLSQRKEEPMDQLPLFTFSVIANATDNFSLQNKLGEGGFGPVYKGVLDDGQHVAVKRLSRNSSQGLNEFKNEVICISKLQHRNLVRLLGCCIHGDEKLLIYEYMSNKSLDLFIFDKIKSTILDWTTRYNIIKGIARGLVYLHQDSRLRIIHRDLKASNILLDQDMNPKISDFGIARSFGGNESQGNTERVVGTYGYISPEYALDGIFSMKSDVFSFGVLVLEIVSGKRNRGFTQLDHGTNLMGHAWNLYNEGRSMDLIDVALAKSCNPPEVLRSIEVGLLCVQQNARDRPNMSSVIMMLDGERSLPQPKQPAYFMEGDFFAGKFTGSSNPTTTTNQITITEVHAR